MEGEGTSGTGVKYLIGRTAVQNGIIAGFIATQIATVFGLWFPGAFLPKFDFNQLNGWLIFGIGGVPADVNYVLGALLHYVDGILWGLIFAIIIHPSLGQIIKPLARLTPTNNLLKGIIWGVALWIISSALWMPLLIGPLVAGFGGVGPFLSNFGPVGYQAVFANLLWHTIFGVNLGLMFNPIMTGAPASAQGRAEPMATAAR